MRAAILILVALVVGCAHTEVAPVQPQKPLIVDTPKTVEQIVKDSRFAIFEISQGESSCTAFHIGNGFIVSAHHCKNALGEIVGAPILAKDFIGRIHKAEIVAESAESDLLILKVPTKLFPHLEIEDDSKHTPEGELLMTMGYPLYMSPDFTFDVGHCKGYSKSETTKFIWVDHATGKGYSGGPVISVKTGKVVGIQHKIGVFKEEMENFEDSDSKYTILHTIGISVHSSHLIKILKDNKIDFKPEKS